MRQARGEYVLFLDDDDLLYADHVETLLNALAHDPDCAAAYSLAWRVSTHYDLDGRVEDEHFDMPSLFHQAFCYKTLLHHNFIPIKSVLFRRALYLERGGFDNRLDKLEDWNLWLRYGFRNRFAFVPKTTSLFRVPADQHIMDERQELMDQAISVARNLAISKCRDYDPES
jgi:hypothetical protein